MDDDSDHAATAPSKSQRKRESSALQDVGAMLVELSAERLRKLDLPDRLREAVLDAQRISSRGARRRQMQYIGKVMREVEVEPIVAQLAALRGESDDTKAEFRALEQWRERLLDDDQAVTDWLTRYPDTDAQQLRQLIRKARKEAAEGREPRSSRLLFRMLRKVSAAAPGGE